MSGSYRSLQHALSAAAEERSSLPNTSGNGDFGRGGRVLFLGTKHREDLFFVEGLAKFEFYGSIDT